MRPMIKAMVFFLAASVCLAACKREKQEPSEQEIPAVEAARTGVTEDEILIGTWGPLTGPAALWGAVPRGTKAYFDMINAEGGIHGRKLKLLVRDDAYQPARTKSAVMEMVEKKGIFAMVGGTGTGPGMAVRDYLDDKKVPWIGPTSGSSNWCRPQSRYRFALYPTYNREAKALVRYLLAETDKKDVAFLYQNDDYGKEGLEGARGELRKHGKSLVAEVSVEVTDRDLDSHVLKLKQAEPDAVILWVMPNHAATALRTAAKLDFRPQWAAASTLSDVPLMHKISKGLWEGVIFCSFAELPDSEHPLVRKYHDAYEKFGLEANPQEDWGTFFIAGFFFAEPLVEGLKRVGRDLDREKLVQALETLDRWRGGIGGEITFGPDERQGLKSVFICKCENAKAVRITDWITVE